MTRRTTRSVAAVVLAGALALAGCTGGPPTASSTGGTSAPGRSGTAVFPAQQVDPLVAGMVHRSVKPLPATRLAPGLVPPTNRWFSGLVFGDPQPVFPLPLSFGLTGTGMAFGQPSVVTTAKNIAGGHVPAVGVDVGAASAEVSAYDTVSVTVDSRDAGGAVLGRTVIAEGSPFVAYHAARAGTVTTTVPWTAQADHWTTEVGGLTYGLVVTGGTVADRTISLEESGVATWFPVPADGSSAVLAELARHPLTGGSLGYALGDDTVTTTLTYQAAGSTAYARLPHQSADVAGAPTCDLGTYPSIYGTMTLCAGNECRKSVILSLAM